MLAFIVDGVFCCEAAEILDARVANRVEAIAILEVSSAPDPGQAEGQRESSPSTAAPSLLDGITERFVCCPTLLVSGSVGKREDTPGFESGEQDAQGNVPEAHMPKAQQFQVRELNLRLAEARNEVHSARRVAQALGRLEAERRVAERLVTEEGNGGVGRAIKGRSDTSEDGHERAVETVQASVWGKS